MHLGVFYFIYNLQLTLCRSFIGQFLKEHHRFEKQTVSETIIKSEETPSKKAKGRKNTTKRKASTKKQSAGKKAKKSKGKNAFMFFTIDARPKIIEQNPNLRFGEVGREIGVRWRALSASAKKKYEALAVQDMARVKSEKLTKAALC